MKKFTVLIMFPESPEYANNRERIFSSWVEAEDKAKAILKATEEALDGLGDESVTINPDELEILFVFEGHILDTL